MTKDAAASLLRHMNKESIVDRIIRRLTNTIISGELKPGDKIPTEVELSEAMGVGRNSVREAVKALVAMGILNIRRAEGTFVADGFTQRMLDPITYGLILEGGNTAAVIELRQVMDSGVLQLAIAKATPQDIQKLEDVLTTMEQAIANNPTHEALQQLDIAFHNELERIADNPLIEKFSEVIQRISRPSRDKAVQSFIDQKELSQFLELHRRLLGLLKTKDVERVPLVMREHFKYWEQVLTEKESV